MWTLSGGQNESGDETSSSFSLRIDRPSWKVRLSDTEKKFGILLHAATNCRLADTEKKFGTLLRQTANDRLTDTEKKFGILLHETTHYRLTDTEKSSDQSFNLLRCTSVKIQFVFQYSNSRFVRYFCYATASFARTTLLFLGGHRTKDPVDDQVALFLLDRGPNQRITCSPRLGVQTSKKGPLLV